MPEDQAIRRKPYGLAVKHDLRELGATADKLSAPLDLVHVTSVGSGIRIIEAGQIETTLCKHFGRELVYAFVARPAYRRRDGEEKSDQINRFPLVFVLSPTLLRPPHHLYPFDTGAALGGRYGDTVDPYVHLEDYELEPNLPAAQRHIAWAFGSNRAYFEGDLKPGLANNLPAWKAAGKGYLKIAGLAATGSNRPDKRASAIEVAYADHIPLRDNVRLAILPQQLVEDCGDRNVTFINRLNDLGLDWEAYDWRPNEAPDSFVDEITVIVRRYLEAAGQL